MTPRRRGSAPIRNPGLGLGLGLLVLGAGAACELQSDAPGADEAAHEPDQEARPPGWVVALPHRYVSEEDHVSLVLPRGWTVARDRGALLLSSRSAGGRSTIFIQSAAVDGDWVGPRTRELAVGATERALLGLPGAIVRGAESVARNPSGLEGVAWGASFLPSHRRGARYDRRHVLLLGEKRHFHVVHTAPAGLLPRAAAVFDEVVASVKEEA